MTDRFKIFYFFSKTAIPAFLNINKTVYGWIFYLKDFKNFDVERDNFRKNRFSNFEHCKVIS